MPEWLPSVVVQVFAAGVVWGTLKAELRALRDKADAAKESADKAHARIDRMMEQS